MKVNKQKKEDNNEKALKQEQKVIKKRNKYEKKAKIKRYKKIINVKQINKKHYSMYFLLK